MRTGERYGLLCDVAKIHPSEPDEGWDSEQGGGFGIADSIKVQEMDKEKRNEIIVCCLERGAGMRQLSRLTGVTYGVINRLRGRM